MVLVTTTPLKFGLQVWTPNLGNGRFFTLFSRNVFLLNVTLEDEFFPELGTWEHKKVGGGMVQLTTTTPKISLQKCP